MPVPDASAFIGNKRRQANINASTAESTLKFRAPQPYGMYVPSYGIQYLPPNALQETTHRAVPYVPINVPTGKQAKPKRPY